MDDGVVRIGACRLAPGRGLLLRDGQSVHIRAKTYALLCFLVANAGRVLGKDELMAALWPGLVVTEDSLTQVVRDLRRVLGGDAGHVQTVARRGYLFQAEAPRAVAEGGTHGPRVAVLPFEARSDQAGDMALALGLAEELTHGLARYGLVTVVARHSAFQFNPGVVPVAEVAARLGADYVVEGSLRRLGDVAELSLSMMSAEGGRQVWGQSYALGRSAMRLMQEDAPHHVVSRLMHDVEKRIGLRAAPSATGNLDAFGHFVAGVAALRSYGPGVNEAGRAHLETAVALDPGFALAHCYLALAELIIGGYVAASEPVKARALTRAEHALRLSPGDSRCYWMTGTVRLYSGQFQAAELDMRRGLELNPSDADLLMALGHVVTARGNPDEGVALMTRGLEINPLHPPWYHRNLSLALIMAGRYAEARARCQLFPKDSAQRLTMLACCQVMCGDAAGAAASLARAFAMDPDWDPLANADQLIGLEHDHDRARFHAMIEAALKAWRGG